MSSRYSHILALIVAWSIVADVSAETAPSALKLSVYPDHVDLAHARDRQSIVVMVTNNDGSTVDVTNQIKLSFDKANVVAFENESIVPLADGSSIASLQYQSLTASLPITVSGAKEFPQLGFRQDILPLFTKAGCNTGKCHGAASGKDGFRLSLFGYDPVGDHFRLTREMNGRRVNLADPENCLLVNKAVGKVPHTGGARIDEEDESYALLMEWLKSGAPVDPKSAPVPTSISVYPSEAVFAQPGLDQKLVVMANYSDGSNRDVTAQTVFLSNNEAAATVSDLGMIHAKGPGTAFVLARFDQFTQGASLIVRPGTSFTFPDVPEYNYIDQLVYNRLKNLNVIPSDTINDEQFLRRLYLDLTGQLPTTKQRSDFLASKDPNKRQQLVDTLIKLPEFRDLWVMHWAELLQIRSNNGISSKALSLYDRWLRDQVHSGKTIDQIVRELMPASGGTFENPATNYFQTETSPQLRAESVAQTMLGTRIQCAQCHNHPFDQWTMDDYYGFASFFSQVGYKQSVDPRELTIYNLGEGDIKHPIADRKVKPTFLGGDLPELVEGQDYREPLAAWIASENNMAFARNVANIVWAHFIGVGIVDPIDDFRVSNPPSNPELLNALAKKLIEYRFDVQLLSRDICNSRTYQLSVSTNPTNALDTRHFSHATVRRLRAEIMLDCLSQVTEAKERLPGLPVGGKAVQIADGPTPNYFLTTFGRSTRQSPCSCEVKTNPTLSQAMHLLNGETTNGKIKQGKLIERLVAENTDPKAIVKELFQRCYGREPDMSEQAGIAKQLAEYENIAEGLEDLFWGLLNSNEFIFNH